jgi:hypothetical protein
MPRCSVIAAALGALLLAAGCSPLKPYPNELPVKNLSIRTATQSGSMFASVRAEVDVHSIDGACRVQYIGTVALDQPSVAVGIAPEHSSYLVFQFMSSNLLGGSRGRISRELVLRPQAGQRYEIDVTYRDDLYDVVVRERSPRGALREVPLQDLRSCRPAASAPSSRGAG